jgi:multidrug resistance efflux pump
MDPLEGTTLELIHRRRVGSFYPGYTIILLVVGLIVALPLVKVDVVCISGGMIRPHQEPSELIAPVTGVVDWTDLKDFRHVMAGDTLLEFKHKVPEARINEYQEMIGYHQNSLHDINSILDGRNPTETSRYIQSFRNHLTQLEQVQVEQNFLFDEFSAAETLYHQMVIPIREFEESRSHYLSARVKYDGLKESYKSLLEEELFRLEMENRRLQSEIDAISASVTDQNIVAPVSGILHQCRGITGGSVLYSGGTLGFISPDGPLVAECYVNTRDITDIESGQSVRIRFDRNVPGPGSTVHTSVDQIDPDAVIVNGEPLFRVRCFLSDSIHSIPGMTFSASMLLRRATLISLLTEKMDLWVNPSITTESRRPIQRNGS